MFDKIDKLVDSVLHKNKRSLTESKKDDLSKSFTQYMKSGNTFSPVGPIVLVPKLESCAYEVSFSPSGLIFEKVRPRTDSLLKFEDSTMSKVLSEVKRFWSLKDNFNKLGFLHNRGILLYGPPGTGKTCLVHQIAEGMIEQEDTIMFGKNINIVSEALNAFRQIEPDRRVVVVLEDMDEYIGYSERDALQLLDGTNSVDNVLFIGTTNYIEKFPPRLLRPGRFDRRVKIGFPPYEGRLAYLNNKLNGIVEAGEIEQLAEKTDGFSFGHLRELVIAGYAFQEDVEHTLKRLRGVSYPDLPEREDSYLSECINKRK